MSGEGILSTPITVGHLQFLAGRVAFTDRVALETLNRAEIVTLIRSIDDSFSPDGEYAKKMSVEPERVTASVSLEATVGDLLWKSESYYEQTLQKIFRHDLEKNRDRFPARMALEDIGAWAELPAETGASAIVLLEPRETTRMILSLAGIVPVQSNPLPRMFPDTDIFQGRVRYAVNVEGVLVAPWENAKRIRLAVNWAREFFGKPPLDLISSELISVQGRVSPRSFSMLEARYTPFWSYKDVEDGFRETRMYSYHKGKVILPHSSEEAKTLVGALVLLRVSGRT